MERKQTCMQYSNKDKLINPEVTIKPKVIQRYKLINIIETI